MSNSYSESEHLVLRPEVAVAVLEEGAVLLDLDTKFFFSVNDTGWAIIRIFEDGTTLERVRAQCRAWGAKDGNDPEVEAFLKVLMDERLVARDGETNKAGETNTSLRNDWSPPTIQKHSKPLQRIMTSAFDPSIPLAE